jgi:hypothetical protein
VIRRTLLAAAIWTLALGGPLRADEYIVEISGSDGTAFGGTCLLITANNNRNFSASGAVPLVFEFSGDVISCAIQRKTGNGDLRMVIRSSRGRVVAESSKVLPFGVIMAAGR